MIADIGPLALGFCNPSPASSSWQLLSPFFPDKVGGRPAWLSLSNLPRPEQLACPLCREPMTFLLQIYSTIDDRLDCFHRTLFVFMCRNGECHRPPSSTGQESDSSSMSTDTFQLPFGVFRSQLARENKYYSSDPPPSDLTLEDVSSRLRAKTLPCAEHFTSLCPVCGCSASKACSSCKSVRYCSKAHQTIHWRLEHKAACSTSTTTSNINNHLPKLTPNDFLLPEYELESEIVDSESNHHHHHNPSSSEEGEEEEGDEDGQENADIEADGRPGADSCDGLIELARRETKAEACLRKFKEAMSDEPEQVVRFQRGGLPLWIYPKPDLDIPRCEYCGSDRIFEFQITPQLLIHLKLDQPGKPSPDFGSLYIFTCSASCQLPDRRPSSPLVAEDVDSTTKESPLNGDTIISYKREFICRQRVE